MFLRTIRYELTVSAEIRKISRLIQFFQYVKGLLGIFAMLMPERDTRL